MTRSDAETILRLRLILCRAAQPDSLQWWDDWSLTAEGAFVVERLFGKRPRIAAARIALAAARTRHWAAIPQSAGVVHLFDFGNEIEDALNAVPPKEDWISSTPITSAEILVSTLRSIVTESIEFEHGEPNEDGVMEIRLSANVTKRLNSPLALASVLALAYDSARPSKPVFPFLRG